MNQLTIPQLGATIIALNEKIGLLSQVQNSELYRLSITALGNIDGVAFTNQVDLIECELPFKVFLNDYIPNLIARRTILEIELRARVEPATT